MFVLSLLSILIFNFFFQTVVVKLSAKHTLLRMSLPDDFQFRMVLVFGGFFSVQ